MRAKKSLNKRINPTTSYHDLLISYSYSIPKGNAKITQDITVTQTTNYAEDFNDIDLMYNQTEHKARTQKLKEYRETKEKFHDKDTDNIKS
jgi:hypothetical protein